MKEVDKIIDLLAADKDDQFMKSIKENITLLNSLDNYKRSFLFYVVLDNKINLLTELITLGAEINLKDKEGWTPLHYAAQDKFVEIGELLIKSGADVNAKDRFGNTVMCRAVFASREDGNFIKMLLKYGADPNIENNSGVSALQLSKTIGNYNVSQFFE